MKNCKLDTAIYVAKVIQGNKFNKDANYNSIGKNFPFTDIITLRAYWTRILQKTERRDMYKRILSSST
ncbi:hypothetical protein GmHk_18G050570 [Glycine max]|nr:hypothetical protein GmHk_18G050570 [Glycine max]